VAEPRVLFVPIRSDATGITRLKTGARTPAAKPHVGRAEFFALPVDSFGARSDGILAIFGR